MFAGLLAWLLLSAAPPAPCCGCDQPCPCGPCCACNDAPAEPEAIPAPKQEAQAIRDGFYRVAGREATAEGPKPYSGVARVRHLGKDLWLVIWYVGDGPGLTGMGVLQGKMLQVSWSRPAPDGGRQMGLSTYAVQDAGTLDGTWVALPPHGRGTERLTYLAGLELTTALLPGVAP